MKYLPSAFLFLVAFLSVNFVTAQIGRIEKITISYEDQMVDVLSVNIQPARKDAQKAFDDWMDDRYDINMKGGGLFSDKNLRSAEAITIPAVAMYNISLFTRTEERGEATQMLLFASRGLGNFIGANEEKAFSGLEDVFDSFLSFYLPEYYQERVMEAQAALADLRESFTDTQEDIAKNKEEILELQAENQALNLEAAKLEREINDAEHLLEKRQQKRKEVTRELGKRKR